MSAPSEIYTDQLVKVQSGERLATTPEPNSAPDGVTCLREARGRGYRAATQVKGLSPEMLHCSGSRRFSYARKAIIPYPFWQGYGNPAGSETVARYQTEGMGTREARYAPYRVRVTKPNKGKVSQMAYRVSDQFILVMKQGNACGAKGLAGKSFFGGTTLSVPGDGIASRVSADVTCAFGGETFLKSRMREEQPTRLQSSW
ncbi:MAG: hypothetical protein A2268_01825 [Candidatus Raymondbacteria bacterium RifOxyA12_full_50_37]|uniref:Uncharacterized protein n=1 Tax=Candidatus Raymondbacteria bacterium RIFOXYD12_FULL_49_13 TaxID=1817890 RepID=A0A1F7FHW7_UNCRA|nr:MAG: hypothetical protein A2268_01825 [Candidatus Raymondbacteria bacterium RifOxyA12_full_50_37]OGJ89308.1 MAG: hypothetical protein A2248_17445 [Candidatus Raymondbacteria bacterium RIFOXYA2_FULL_49_16]OGK00717.1 MAG: hypothetical protein A2350_18065 [Candidatus Raymondbacteria bacterium RifOxyB12_full_50_8]OGK04966.1 MAG: hypothetical protein A2487_15950 [Candidatus Raymondbacteria bacterium RifOxyC12_full_50_8]OGK06077.1 MAG: hypothetical protein A2519_06080 [Candidatus Raymondbacteria b